MTQQHLPGSTGCAGSAGRSSDTAKDDLRIGWIGTGCMGIPMVTHLLRNGFQVSVHNRTKSRAEPLLAMGASWYDFPSAVARNSHVVFTIVGTPADVESVYFGESGIFSGIRPGTILCDMTTSRPELMVRLAKAAKSRLAVALDAPVTGAVIGATLGTLSIFVGGEEAAFRRILPILKVFGKKIVRFGDVGMGQKAKLANQIALAGEMIGVCESLYFAQSAGVEPRNWWELVKLGAAGSVPMTNLGAKILDDDWSAGFFVAHFAKDLKICLEECRRMKIRLPGLELAEKMYRRLAAQGFARNGIQTLWRQYVPNAETSSDAE